MNTIVETSKRARSHEVLGFPEADVPYRRCAIHLTETVAITQAVVFVA